MYGIYIWTSLNLAIVFQFTFQKSQKLHGAKSGQLGWWYSEITTFNDKGTIFKKILISFISYLSLNLYFKPNIFFHILFVCLDNMAYQPFYVI